MHVNFKLFFLYVSCFKVIFEEMNPPKPVLRISPIHKLVEALDAAVEEPPKPKATPTKKRPLPSEVLKLNTMSSQKKPKIAGSTDIDSQRSDETSQMQSNLKRPKISEEKEDNQTKFEHKQPIRRQQNFKLNYRNKYTLLGLLFICWLIFFFFLGKRC